MAPVMSDLAERRLRAARPTAADVPDDAAERAAGIAVRDAARAAVVGPARVAPRRGARWAVRALALGAAAAAVAVAIGLPGSKSGPQNAAASPLALAVHWFAPAPGTVLHVRSTLASRAPDGHVDALRQEYWQSSDHPDAIRTIGLQDGVRGKQTSDGLYDAAADTIYVNVPPSADERAARLKESIDKKIAAAKASGAGAEVIARLRSDERKVLRGEVDDPGAGVAGDPLIAQVRAALEHGDARVVGHGPHAGRDAYAIALDLDLRDGARAAKPVRWTLWIAAASTARPSSCESTTARAPPPWRPRRGSSTSCSPAPRARICSRCSARIRARASCATRTRMRRHRRACSRTAERSGGAGPASAQRRRGGPCRSPSWAARRRSPRRAGTCTARSGPYVVLELARQRGRGARPSRSTTTARTTAPRSSSGAPTTAASATAGWATSADSTSNGPMR